MLGLDRPIWRFPIGVWIALVALLLQLLAWGAQAYSLIDWDGAVELGLQSDRLTGGEAEHTWAMADWGIAAADIVWCLPVAVVALVGLLRSKFYGFVGAMMQFAIGVYWPLVFAFQRWTTHQDTVLAVLMIWGATSLLAIVCLWANRRYYPN